MRRRFDRLNRRTQYGSRKALQSIQAQDSDREEAWAPAVIALAGNQFPVRSAECAAGPDRSNLFAQLADER